MAFTVTPLQRRVAMAALLVLAIAGAVIRYSAPDPSTLRDIGTLMLVLWVPAIGNLIGYLKGRIPHQAPPPAEFAAGSAFTPHLRAELTTVELPEGLLQALDPLEDRCTLLVGRHGFTARLAQPVAQWLTTTGPQIQALELLRPQLGLRRLPPGTAFHVLVGTVAVARARVLA